MIKAVIFDMDGLMFDTERLSLDAWKYGFKLMGIPFDRGLILKMRGTSQEAVRKMIMGYAGEGCDYDRLNEARLKYVDDSMKKDGVPVKKGLFELLKYLKQNGYRVALATSTGSSRAMGYLDEVGATIYFDQFVFGNMVKRYKPAPDIFLKAIELLKVEASECIILEDSPNGLEAAYNAGSNPVMVPDLSQPDEDISKILYAKCDSLLDVIPLLERERASCE